jgi:hypothetical protein
VRGVLRRWVRRAGDGCAWLLHACGARLLLGAGLSGARLSTRLLCGLVMQLMISYNVAVYLCFELSSLAEPFFGGDWDDAVEALFVIGSIVAAVLTYCVIFVQTMITLRTFRWHVGRLRAGDYGFVPGGKRKYTYDLSDTVGYMGFQVRPRGLCACAWARVCATACVRALTGCWCARGRRGGDGRLDTAW